MQTRAIPTTLNAAHQRIRAVALVVVALVCAMLWAQRVNAQMLIDHSGGFANHSDLTANGSISWPAYTFGTLARITNGTGQAGSFWSNNKVDVTGFTTTFTVDINDAKAFADGDGFMFVIQNDPRGAAALGPGGGGLGYGHDSPGPIDPMAVVKSAGIKFDVFQNGGIPCELSDNETGLFFDGDSPTCASPGTDEVDVDLNPTPINLHSRNPFQVKLTYDGAMLTETITNLVTGGVFTQSYAPSDDIPTHVGGNTAWVGFSGGTGGRLWSKILRAGRIAALVVARSGRGCA